MEGNYFNLIENRPPRDVITDTERALINEWLAVNRPTTSVSDKPKRFSPWIARRRRKIAG